MTKIVAASSSVARILSFADLPDGWNYGAGVASFPKAVENALKIRSVFERFGSDAIESFPDSSGAVLVSGYTENDELDVTCMPDNDFSIEHSVDGELVKSIEDMSLGDVVDYIGKLGWRLKSICDFFIHSTTATNLIDSSHSLTKNQRTERLSLSRHVPLPVTEMSADIYGQNMNAESQVTPQYIYVFQPPNSQRIAR